MRSTTLVYLGVAVLTAAMLHVVAAGPAAGHVRHEPPASSAPVLEGVAPAVWNTRVERAVDVRLSGADLARQPVTVTFGTLPAARVTVDGGRVTAVPPAIQVPAGAVARVVPVTVTTPFGTSTLPRSFTYQFAPQLITLSADSWNTRVERRARVTLRTQNVRPSDRVTVTFGGVAAERDPEDRDRITVFVPEIPRQGSTRTVDVRITTPTGTSVLPDSFTYRWGPVIEGIAPAVWNTRVERTRTVRLDLGNVRPGEDVSVQVGGQPAEVAATGRGEWDVLIPSRSPSGQAETVAVLVETAQGKAVARDAFTYQYGPVLRRVSPDSWDTSLARTLRVELSTSNVNPRDAVQVTFGGVRGRRVDDAGGRLLFEVPAFARDGLTRTVDVVLSTPAGSSRLVGGFTYRWPAVVPTLASVSPDRGPAGGGTVMTLRGTGFTGTTGVRVGSSPVASFVVESDSVVTATVPQGTPGAYEAISVTTPAGTSAERRYFTYDLPALTITAVSPASGCTTCGTAVTIRGTGLSEVASVLFGDSAAARVPGPDGTILASAPFHPEGTVTVTVATADGRVASLPAAFTYTAPPAATPVPGPLPSTDLTLSSLSPDRLTSVEAMAHPPITLTGSGLSSLPASGALRFVKGTGRYDVYSYTVVDDRTVSLELPTLAGIGDYYLEAVTSGGTVTLAAALTVY